MNELPALCEQVFGIGDSMKTGDWGVAMADRFCVDVGTCWKWALERVLAVTDYYITLEDPTKPKKNGCSPLLAISRDSFRYPGNQRGVTAIFFNFREKSACVASIQLASTARTEDSTAPHSV